MFLTLQNLPIELYPYSSKPGSDIPGTLKSLNLNKIYLPSQIIALRVLIAFIRDVQHVIFLARARNKWYEHLKRIFSDQVKSFWKRAWGFRSQSANLNWDNLAVPESSKKEAAEAVNTMRGEASNKS